MKGKFYSLLGLTFAFLIALGSPSWAAEKSSKKDPEAQRTERRDDKAAASARQKINLNSANSAALQTLPGVGPEIADAIIAARPFKSVDELKDVKGIGEVRFEQIRPHVVAPAPRANVGKPAASTRGADKSTESPRRSEVDRPGQTRGLSGAEAKVNINTASQADLEGLLGIGPVKARAIIDARPFKSIDEIKNVKGIKEGTYDEIRDRITVR